MCDGSKLEVCIIIRPDGYIDGFGGGSAIDNIDVGTVANGHSGNVGIEFFAASVVLERVLANNEFVGQVSSRQFLTIPCTSVFAVVEFAGKFRKRTVLLIIQCFFVHRTILVVCHSGRIDVGNIFGLIGTLECYGELS